MTEDTQIQPRLKTLKNGAVYDLDKGRIVSNPGGGKSAITPEKSRQYRELRAAKTARLLREAIVTETADALQMAKTGPAEAIAAAGGILWREIVLSPDAYPRDRLAAYSELSERAEMTSNNKRVDADKNTGETASALMDAATELVRALASVIQPREVIDAPATDIRNEVDSV